MDLAACPRCAGLGMRMRHLGEGGVLGMEGSVATCGECGYQGMPLLFDAEEDYRVFREEHRGPPGAELAPREAAARADRDADAAAEEAASLPMPPELRSEPGFLDRVPLVPYLMAALGALALVLGLLTLGWVRGVSEVVPLAGGPLGIPLALLGLGILLVALRLLRQRGAMA
jgi:hypothetical protein